MSKEIDPIEIGCWSDLEKWALRDDIYTSEELLEKRKELRRALGGQIQ